MARMWSDAGILDKYNATRVLGLLQEQKLTASLRMLAFGACADQVDEIAKMGKSTILDSLVRFSQRAIIRGAASMFDEEVLQSIMMTCIILHNMIVEDEYDYDEPEMFEPDPISTTLTRIDEWPMGANGQPL
ncbi:unnamed protein product, partial [Prunus brigantina]